MAKKQPVETATEEPKHTMTSRIQPITEDELIAAVKQRNASSGRLERMRKYEEYITEIETLHGGHARVALDGEKSLRELSLRLTHAGRRIGRKVTAISSADGTLIVTVKPADEPQAATQAA